MEMVWRQCVSSHVFAKSLAWRKFCCSLHKDSRLGLVDMVAVRVAGDSEDAAVAVAAIVVPFGDRLEAFVGHNKAEERNVARVVVDSAMADKAHDLVDLDMCFGKAYCQALHRETPREVLGPIYLVAMVVNLELEDKRMCVVVAG